MRSIKAVFFDLGKTLIYPKDSWHPIHLRAYKALRDALIAQGVAIADASKFHHNFANALNKYYLERELTLRETGTLPMLQKFLAEKYQQDTPLSNLRAPLDAFYAITQSNWQLETDAYITLEMLKKRGYQLAIISNAGDDPDVQALLDTHNLRHFFNFVLTSAVSGYRKPHAHIFKETLTELALRPEECAMVGDTLNADIQGANELGIYSIWINRRVNKEPRKLADIHPKAIIQTLSELPNLLLEIT